MGRISTLVDPPRVNIENRIAPGAYHVILQQHSRSNPVNLAVRPVFPFAEALLHHLRQSQYERYWKFELSAAVM